MPSSPTPSGSSPRPSTSPSSATAPPSGSSKAASATSTIEAGTPPVDRIGSIDVYRGFVMFLMLAEVLGLEHLATQYPDSTIWQWIGFHTSHVAWTGCSLHDMIQPSFSFLVGAALAFSIVKRAKVGQSLPSMIWHATWRAIVLVLLGVALRSNGIDHTNWTFEDTLSQIGLGYLPLFFIALAPRLLQYAILVLLLGGYFALFAFYPLPAEGFDRTTVGVAADWPHDATGLAAHWNLNTNAAFAFDQWFLNLFSRPEPWQFNRGGYSTLSFIPTLATMLIGLLAGQLLRSPRGLGVKFGSLVGAGILAIAAGWALGWFGICPVVKKIWTPSWTLYSGGICLLILAALLMIVDGWKLRRWAFPLLVIGANSIVAYVMAWLCEGFAKGLLTKHLPQRWFQHEFAGVSWEGTLYGAAVLAIFWLVLLWMYRKRIFVRI
jgi:heparan-alpha-glucosaminide N-acetyltransferase